MKPHCEFNTKVGKLEAEEGKIVRKDIKRSLRKPSAPEDISVEEGEDGVTL